MFIIIEGTDASGKSTLVDAIKEGLLLIQPNKKLEFFHKSKPQEMTRGFYKTMLHL